MSVHREYCSTLEALLSRRLEEIGSSFGRFEDVFESSLEEGKEGVEGVEEALRRAGDFEEFAGVMKGMYDEFYGVGEGASEEAKGNEGDQSYHLRILWDIENVPIPRNISGFSFASNLISYCEEMFRGRAGADTLCTAFHCPSKRTFTEADGRGMDRAQVEQVVVQVKREDADRKMVARLQRESRVLPAGRTCFVVVTSDLDFVSSMKGLGEGGYTVGCLHRAEGYEQAKALGGYADWAQHLSVVEGRCGEEEGGEGVGGKKRNVVKTVVKKGRYTGTVQFWGTGGWGFIKVSKGGGKVFCHNLALPPASHHRFLVVGEECEFDVIETEKGPRAENVVGLGGGMLTCQASKNGRQGGGRRRGRGRKK